MKNLITAFSVLFLILLCVNSCNEKIVIGNVISIPASMSMDDLMGDKINDLQFSEGYVKVKLEDGTVVEALATKEQIVQAYNGKTVATLEKTNEDKWKVVKLEKKEDSVENY